MMVGVGKQNKNALLLLVGITLLVAGCTNGWWPCFW